VSPHPHPLASVTRCDFNGNGGSGKRRLTNFHDSAEHAKVHWGYADPSNADGGDEGKRRDIARR